LAPALKEVETLPSGNIKAETVAVYLNCTVLFSLWSADSRPAWREFYCIRCKP